jgi:hypothetical protein
MRPCAQRWVAPSKALAPPQRLLGGATDSACTDTFCDSPGRPISRISSTKPHNERFSLNSAVETPSHDLFMFEARYLRPHGTTQGHQSRQIIGTRNPYFHPDLCYQF